MESSSENKIRINRFLAKCGLGARRNCEKFITQGRVTVNGTVVTALSFQVDTEMDKVEVDGKAVAPLEKEFNIILNKPKGYVVSREAQGGKSVFELLKGFPKNLQYAGRLDADSEGLLFLSTNGDIIQALTHPRYKVSKIYLVTTDRPLSESALAAFRKGVGLDDGPTQPAQIDPIRPMPPGYRIILHEGRNRQIRRMMDALGYRVYRLTRVAFGLLTLGSLKRGDFRSLSENELWKLKRNLKIKEPASAPQDSDS